MDRFSTVLKYVSKSDILGPNDNLCDIKNLVLFEKGNVWKFHIKL